MLFEATTQTTSIWTQLTKLTKNYFCSVFPIAPFPLHMSANVFSHISEEAITAVILKATLFSAVELDKRQKAHSRVACLSKTQCLSLCSALLLQLKNSTLFFVHHYAFVLFII